jgi:hypothetical protein
VTANEYRRLIEANVIAGPVELLEGQVCFSRFALCFSPTQTRAAATAGVESERRPRSRWCLPTRKRAEVAARLAQDG